MGRPDNPNNCATCKHKQNPDGGHCYMFRFEPAEMCAQHTSQIHAQQAAPKQEAQEPVGVVEHAQAQTSYIHWTAAPPPNGAKLYTAPQQAPAPPSDDVVRDAARWRMAVLIGSELMLRPDKRTHATAVKAYMDATHSGLGLTGAVDAALAAQGGKV